MWQWNILMRLSALKTSGRRLLHSGSVVLRSDEAKSCAYNPTVTSHKPISGIDRLLRRFVSQRAWRSPAPHAARHTFAPSAFWLSPAEIASLGGASALVIEGRCHCGLCGWKLMRTQFQRLLAIARFDVGTVPFGRTPRKATARARMPPPGFIPGPAQTPRWSRAFVALSAASRDTKDCELKKMVSERSP